MPRFFIEVAYKGTNYGGFQRQDNAVTIQSEVEKALKTYFREEFMLTGSSRTDAGVHARQNFFHFDSEILPLQRDFAKIVYHLNAILPPDIVVRSVFPVKPGAHCRFDALSRTYHYTIYRSKDPFLADTAYYHPFKCDMEILRTAAAELFNHTDFQAFSKKNTQVFTYQCSILSSEWTVHDDRLIYSVTANRFLRGMVKGLVGTMLRAATREQTMEAFRQIITSRNSAAANFAVPSHGLCLQKVSF
jgi:tRNA pseudouridine38-40 synthase